MADAAVELDRQLVQLRQRSETACAEAVRAAAGLLPPTTAANLPEASPEAGGPE